MEIAIWRRVTEYKH